VGGQACSRACAIISFCCLSFGEESGARNDRANPRRAPKSAIRFFTGLSDEVRLLTPQASPAPRRVLVGKIPASQLLREKQKIAACDSSASPVRCFRHQPQSARSNSRRRRDLNRDTTVDGILIQLPL